MDFNEQTDLPSIIQQSPVFLTVFDAQLRLRWCNRWAWGMRSEEWIGRSTEGNIVPEDRGSWLHALRNAIDLGLTSNGTCRTTAPGLVDPARLDYRVGQVRVGNETLAMVISHDTTLQSGRPDPRHFLLTTKCKKIIRFLLSRGPSKGSAIGRHLGETSSNGQATSTLRIILANLEERGILTNGQNGYSVAPGFLDIAVDIVGNCRQ